MPQNSDCYLCRNMVPSRILDLFSQSLPLQKLQESIASKVPEIELSGLVGSALSLILAKVAQAQQRPMMCVMNDKESAAYLLNDLENIVMIPCIEL